MRIQTEGKLFFSLISMPRSGSTIFCRLFDALENGCCVSEPFHARGTHLREFRYKDLTFSIDSEEFNPRKYLESYRSGLMRSDLSCAGVKQVSLLGQDQWSSMLLNKALFDLNCAVLRRPDNVVSSLYEKRGAFGDPTFKQIIDAHARFYDLAEEHKLHVLCYEDFCRNPMRYLNSRLEGYARLMGPPDWEGQHHFNLVAGCSKASISYSVHQPEMIINLPEEVKEEVNERLWPRHQQLRKTALKRSGYRDALDVVIISDAKTPHLESITRDALYSLFESETEVEIRAFVVESSDHDFRYVHPNVTMVKPSPPFNYHKYANLGRRLGKAEFVCICNNDVVFYKGWASSIIEAMRQDPELLSASPWAAHTHMLQGYRANVCSAPVYDHTISRYLCGWCIFQRRSLYDRIGNLCEDFPFYYCDNDYSMTLKSLGIRHALIPDSQVDHVRQQTYYAMDLETREHLSCLVAEPAFNRKWSL